MPIDDLKKALTSLSLEEKCRLVSGYSTMGTFPIKEKGIRSLAFSDGPNGVRKELAQGDSMAGISRSVATTCFPTGVGLASTFNEELMEEIGVALGKECVDNQVDILLGPAINIQRNPLCGRNFEYMSEDPLLAGKLSARLVKGIQSLGVGACVKHFACNGNEKYRFVGDSILDERALHDIYLKPFEIVVKEAKPYAFMTAYNRVNGTFCSENDYLLNKTLRADWGFDGLIMTDWGGTHDKVEAIRNGLSLEMPGMVEHNVRVVYDAVKANELPEEKLDSAVKDILNAIERTDQKAAVKADYKAHYDLAVKAGIEGAVLLENDGTLPLRKQDHYLVVGDLFRTMRYQGSGSSLLNPKILKTHVAYFDELGISYDFVRGYDEAETSVNKSLLKEALEAAKSSQDTVLFYGGQNDYVESEGFDREDMKLPANQLEVLDGLLKLGKKVVFVLFGGSPVELPFKNKVSAIMNMNLSGEGEGEATAKLLFGLACPSGRLSQTWMKRYQDVPFGNEFTSTPNEVYKESIFVGYRHYLSLGKEVNYPFGYGLSYTKFGYEGFEVSKQRGGVEVSFALANLGECDGSEVVQVYVKTKDFASVRPLRELVGFKKVFLKAGEKANVTLLIPKERLQIYDISTRKEILEEGDYIFEIGASSAKAIMESSPIHLDGEKLKSSSYDEVYKAYLSTGKIDNSDFEKIIGRPLPEYKFGKRPYTMETPIGELKTFVGRIFAKSVSNVGLKQYKKALKMPDGPEKEREKKAGLFVYKMMNNNSLRSLCFSSSGGFPYNVAVGIKHLCNWKIAKGLKAIKEKENKDYEK